MADQTLNERIIGDWVTLKNFADKTGINYGYLRTTLNGKKRLKTVVNTLIKHNYIRSADDLPKKKEA